jgi:hypothetical protein
MTSRAFFRVWIAIVAAAGCSGEVVVEQGEVEPREEPPSEETPCEAADACGPLEREMEVCAGGGSVRERVCNGECAWSDWTECGAAAGCEEGTTIELPCEEHGTQPFSCAADVWEPAGDCFVPEWLSIDAGIFHTCGIRANRSIECWGSDQSGESSPPEGKFAAVSAGGYDTCALREDGTLVCWGSMQEGIANIPDGSFERLSLGMGQGCLMLGLEATCWGDSSYNQTAIPPGEYLMVDSGRREGCGVRTDAALRCWGYNYYPILDDMPAGAFTTVTIGDGHACALDPEGHPVCWGRDDYQQASGAPADVELVSVNAGAEHTCGIDHDGALHCWGWNAYGQLTAPDGVFVQVTGGEYHSCALDAQGKATCWGGGNPHGELDVPPMK